MTWVLARTLTKLLRRLVMSRLESSRLVRCSLAVMISDVPDVVDVLVVVWVGDFGTVRGVRSARAVAVGVDVEERGEGR